MNWKFLSLSTVFIGVASMGVVVSVVYVVVNYWPREGDAVILVHGLSEDGSSWGSQGVLDGLTKDGKFTYLGDIFHDEEGKLRLRSGTIGGTDLDKSVPLYTVSLRERGEGDIRRSGEELAFFVDHVRGLHPNRRVTLVGFSLGGVVAREYLTTARSLGIAPPVRRLVTISSPHLGTELAYLSILIRNWKGLESFDRELAVDKASSSAIASWMRSLQGEVQGFVLRGVESFSDDMPQIDSEAAAMLLPPDFGGSYLKDLNGRPHPEEIEYLCITTEKNLMTLTLREMSDDGQGLDALKSTIGDLIRKAIRLHRGGGSFEAAASGDGAVSLFSQDLNQIPAFANSEDGLRATVIHIEGAHTGEAGRKLAGILTGLVLGDLQGSESLPETAGQ